PKLLARLWIKAFELLGHAEDQLVVVVHADDDGGAPRAAPIAGIGAIVAARLLVPPDFTAGSLIDRQQELPLAGTAPENSQLAVENRRGSIAPLMDELADIFPPELLAGEVVANQAGRAVTGDDALTVGHRRRRTIRVRGVSRFLILVN